MNELLIELMNTEIRNFFQIVIGLVGIMIILCTMVHPRKSIWVLFIFTLMKSIYSQIITGLLVYMNGGIVTFLPIFNAMILPIIVLAVGCLCINDPPHKVIPAMILAEILNAIVVFLCFLSVNALEGRSDVLTFNGPFMWRDLLLLPLFSVAFCLFYRRIRPFLLRYRDYEFRHPKLPMILVGAYYATASLSYVIDYWNTKQVQLYYCFFICWISFLILIGSILFRQMRKEMNLEQERLQLQQKLLSAHYVAVRAQDMEESSRLLESKMEEILSTDLSAISSHRIGAYLQHLRESHDRMQAGMYCEDWMIDAILYYQSERMRKQGKKLICDIHGFSLSTVEEQDYAQLLFRLLEMVSKHTEGNVTITMKTIRNQMLTIISADSLSQKNKSGMRMSWIKSFLKKYEGSIDIQEQKNTIEINILMRTDMEVDKQK